MYKYPDLPALESVKVKVQGILLIIGMYLGFAFLYSGTNIWLYLKYQRYFGDQLLTVQIAVGLMASLSLWIIFRLLTGNYTWKTDNSGLTIGGIYRRKFIGWHEFEDAISRKIPTGFSYVLRTSKGRIPITDLRGTQSANFYASVWQHLRRYGKAGKLELPEEALSLWDIIPDEIPANLSWENSKPPRWWSSSAFFVIFMGLLLTGGFIFNRSNVFLMIFISIAAIFFVILAVVCTLDSVRTARRVILKDDGLEADLPRKSVHILWSDVNAASWGIDKNTNLISIRIDSGTQTIHIPYYSNDDSSSKLILAIIRNLRKARNPQALTIPSTLRVQEKQSTETSMPVHSYQVGESVELRLAIWERAGCLIPSAVFFLLVGLLISNKESPTLVIWGLLGTFLLLCWFVISSYKVRADSNGITKQFLFWKKYVNWYDATDYMEYMTTGKHRTLKRVVLDSNGKILMDVTADVGSKQAKKQFEAFVHARLAQVLADNKLDKPWKARPWSEN